jgi:cysteine-rich repeat protein
VINEGKQIPKIGNLTCADGACSSIKGQCLVEKEKYSGYNEYVCTNLIRGIYFNESESESASEEAQTIPIEYCIGTEDNVTCGSGCCDDGDENTEDFCVPTCVIKQTLKIDYVFKDTFYIPSQFASNVLNQECEYIIDYGLSCNITSFSNDNPIRDFQEASSSLFYNFLVYQVGENQGYVGVDLTDAECACVNTTIENECPDIFYQGYYYPPIVNNTECDYLRTPDNVVCSYFSILDCIIIKTNETDRCDVLQTEPEVKCYPMISSFINGSIFDRIEINVKLPAELVEVYTGKKCADMDDADRDDLLNLEDVGGVVIKSSLNYEYPIENICQCSYGNNEYDRNEFVFYRNGVEYSRREFLHISNFMCINSNNQSLIQTYIYDESVFGAINYRVNILPYVECLTIAEKDLEGFCDFPCGDSIIQYNETCDDNNTISGDGCSSICQIEEGWYCNGTCETLCGDNITAGEEQCDGGSSCDNQCNNIQSTSWFIYVIIISILLCLLCICMMFAFGNRNAGSKSRKSNRKINKKN